MNFKYVVLLFTLFICVFASESKDSLKSHFPAPFINLPATVQYSLRKMQKKYTKKLARAAKAANLKVGKLTSTKKASASKTAVAPTAAATVSQTSATNTTTTPAVASVKLDSSVSKSGSERNNKEAVKKDDQYQWLKKFVSDEEKKMKRKEKREQEAKKAQMSKVMNSPLLDQMVAAQQAKLQEEKAKNATNSGSFNIYKVDNSWSAYFWSFFGQPDKTQLDPDNVLTKALMSSGKVEAHVQTDGKTGETYLALVDKK